MTLPSRLLPAARFPVELVFLLGLALFLPLYEAPKNIFWLAFVVTWVVNRWRAGAWGGPWERWDSLIALWMASGFVVAAFSGLNRNEWFGAGDVVRGVGILWLMRRGGYSAREITWLALALLTGCAIALGWGFWNFLVLRNRPFLELHSVGHVNHSAPYIAMCCALTLSWLLACWRNWGLARRAGMLALCLFLLAGLLVSESRGAIGAFVAVPFALGLAWWRRTRLPLVVLSIGVVVTLAGAVLGGASVVKKQSEGFAKGDYLSHRDTIWKRALIGWETRPLFGFGIGNFAQINDDIVRARVEAKGQTYRAEDYHGANHAHNLYLNTLAERGLFGLAIFVAALFYWASTLWRQQPAIQASDFEWTLWGAATATWIVVVLAGIFNNTFHHEIGMLAMLLLGGWMAIRKASVRLVPVRADADVDQ